jgi:3-oxoadipate enol-lactonase/4-carboxymuconolactone decarboxylase
MRVDGPVGAPAVVLLPGVGTTPASWDAVAGPLAEQLRVIRPDWPGHDGVAVEPGRTTIDDLARGVLAVMDEVGVDRAHVVGLSLGGMVGLHLAAAHPGRVRRLAVLCCDTDPDRAGFAERATAVRAEGIAAVAERSVARWVTEERLRPGLRAMLAGIDPEGYARCCEAIAGLDLDLARVAAPTLVIAGADDPAAPPAGMRALAATLDAGFEVVGPAAHLATVEQPRQIARLLLAHLLPVATAEQGTATRRAVLGDAHVDRAVGATDALTADFQEFLTRYAWGEVWGRPGLGRRERSLVTLGVLVPLGAEGEIALHVRAAVRNGLTPAEIAEVLQHASLYAGLPRANAAFAIARRVLAEMED